MSESAWHNPTNYYHGSYVILVRISGTFVHYAATATVRYPTVATDNSILAAISPLDGRMLDEEVGRDLTGLSSVGVVATLFRQVP
jgi:hypothetical protein